MARPKLTDAERDQRRRRDHKRLAEAMRELLCSEGWKAWLRTRATLHAYSLRNTYLIAQEARRRGFEPTQVAGFKAWLKLGRVVRRGEPGLPILAPVTVKRRDPGGEEEGERRTFFRTVHVWDVSQTAPLPGVEPAPLVPPRQPLSGDSHLGLLEPLEGFAAELGYSVSYRPLRALEGLCDFRARRIAIDAGLDGNARVATLVHELSHALIHGELDGHARLGKGLEELVVEAVTYVSLAAAGLDTGPDSVPYIASWEGHDALEQLQRSTQLIDSLARRIEQTIPPRKQAGQPLPLGAS